MKKLAVFIFFCGVTYSGYSQTKYADIEADFYTQGNNNRTAAEWEPALGTMLVWPLSVPHKLVIELAKDNHLFTLVASDTAKKEAEQWYTKWGITPASNTFIIASQGIDAWWTRDWGPSAVFTKDGIMKLADGKYIYSTPYTSIGCDDTLHFLYSDKDNTITKTEMDDNATIPVGKGLQTPVLDLPFINTGGNVLTDGLGSAFSTCILINENKFYNVPKERFLQLNKDLLGFSNYHIISNFEKAGIQHIDCFMKLLDEERILVAEPPVDHPLFSIYENIIGQELKKLKTAYGRPYHVLGIKTDRYDNDRLAAYTNSIIINKTIYVPLFQIKQDSIALKTWQNAMPGYTVKGFEFALKDEPYTTQQLKDHYKDYGWNNGDALHCRTRAVWDPQMLFISAKKIAAEVTTNNKNVVYITIIDYSKKGLIKEKAQLLWRVAGQKNWQKLALRTTANNQHFFAAIPFHQKDATIEYYVSVVSGSGRTATQPATAPAGFYQFSIK